MNNSDAAWKSILLDDEEFEDWKMIMDQYKTSTDTANTQVVIVDVGRDKNLPLTPVVTDKKALTTKQ